MRQGMRQRRTWRRILGSWACFLIGLSALSQSQELPYRAEFREIPRGGDLSPQNTLFVQRDTLGQLWMFEEGGVSRFDGRTHMWFSYQKLFGHEAPFNGGIRAALLLPDGQIACQFAREQHGIPSQDTLCIFSPTLGTATHVANLPPRGSDEVLTSYLNPQRLEAASLWIVTDTAKGIDKVWRHHHEDNSWKTSYEGRPGERVNGLFSESHVGDFYLTQDPSTTTWRTVHWRNGLVRVRDCNFPYTRSLQELRRFPSHNLLFDSTGTIEVAVWRHEQQPGFQDEHIWTYLPDGTFVPGSQSPLGFDWNRVLDVKHGYRHSECRHNVESQTLWVFIHNRLQVYSSEGTLVMETTFPLPEEFTSTMHDVVFVDGKQAVITSSMGSWSVLMQPRLFNHVMPAEDTKAFDLGSQQIIPWGKDTLLVMTDAGDVYLLDDFGGHHVFDGGATASGMAVRNDTLYLACDDSVVPQNLGTNPGKNSTAPCLEHTSWRLEPHSSGGWMVCGPQGCEFRNQHGQTLAKLRHLRNVRMVLEKPPWILVAHDLGLSVWDLDRNAAQPAFEVFPELEKVRSACQSLAPGNDGDFWIGTKSEGLLRWRPATKEVMVFDVSDGLPSNDVRATLVANNGIVWGSTDHGLFQVNPDNMRVQSYPTHIGGDLPMLAGRPMSGTVDAQGKFWFGGERGVVSLDPSHVDFAMSATPARPLVERIALHDSESPLLRDVTTHFRANNLVFVEFEQARLDIHVRISDLTEPELHQLSYRIGRKEEFDETLPWQNVSGTVLELLLPSPGMWWLEVRVKRPHAGWSPHLLRIPIHFPTPWHEHPTFPWLVGMSGLTLLGLMYLWRTRRLSKKQRALEELVSQRTSSLERALTEKDIYLAETHHRIKNNLQMVSSLISLQARTLGDPEMKQMLLASKSRIDSVALIHQHFQEDGSRLVLPLLTFTRTLARLCSESLSTSNDIVHTNLLGEEVYLTFEQGLPLGMILNELLSNTYKHVVPFQDITKINIRIHVERDRTLVVTYEDNGPGYRDDSSRENALGLRLVERFSEQIHGEVSRPNNAPGCTVIRLKLTHPSAGRSS
jgi:two-component sensor histidine kinase